MFGELFDVDFSSVMLTCTIVYFSVFVLLLVMPHITTDPNFCQKGIVHVFDLCQNRTPVDSVGLQMCPKCSMLKTPSSICCCVKRHNFHLDDDDSKSVQSMCSSKPSGKHSESDLCASGSCDISQEVKQRSSSGNFVRF